MGRVASIPSTGNHRLLAWFGQLLRGTALYAPQVLKPPRFHRRIELRLNSEPMTIPSYFLQSLEDLYFVAQEVFLKFAKRV